MSSWVIPFVWLSIYWATIWIVPTERLCKGLFTRYVLKRLPPKRWWTPGSTGHMYRYMLWWGITIVLEYGYPRFGVKTWALLFWGPVILVVLDDYFFGDDDAWKRRWEGVKNKIKWKMDLPEPVRQEVA